MKQLIVWKQNLFRCLLFLLLCLHQVSVVAAEEYIRVNDYLALHPEQKTVMENFSRIVRNQAMPVQTKLKKTTRIALIYPGIQASDYWRRSVISFEHRLRQISLPYELKTFFSRPSVDTALQKQQLAEALKWQPDYLVFTLDSVAQSRMIERVLARGTPKVILQNITTPLLRWQTSRPFLYVGFDHAEGTQLLADRMLEQIDYQGKYLMLYFSTGYVSQMRGDTFVEEAIKHPRVEQAAAFYTMGNKDKAYRATLQTLQQHPDLKMIFANSTDIALGALQALKETKRLDVLLNGWGGGDTELEALHNQGLDITVMRINDDNGIAMAEAIKLDQQNQTARVPHIFAGDIKLLTKGYSFADIDQLKQQAFRLSGLPQDN